MGYIDNLKDLDLSELTPEQVTAAKLLAYRAASWAIDHAITKFTPEQQEKIHENAKERYLREALAKVRASSDKSASQNRKGCCGHEDGAKEDQGRGCTIVLKRNGSSNSVVSPGFLPGMGWRRAESGLFHLVASEATSERMRSSCPRVTSPGSGTVSRPVPQTAE